MLTLLDQQPRDGTRAAAAQTALTRRTGQPSTLDVRTADRWAGPTATLYTDLNNAAPIPDRSTLPALPFQSRYRDCFPAPHLDELDSDPPHLPAPARTLLATERYWWTEWNGLPSE